MVVGEGTMFDLPDQQLQQTSVSFAPGTYRYVRITWDDRNSGRVPAPATVWARLVSAHATPAPPLVPVQLEKRLSEPQRTRYHLTLPGARLPIVALRLDVGGTYVFRHAAVTEARQASLRTRNFRSISVAIRTPTGFPRATLASL